MGEGQEYHEGAWTSGGRPRSRTGSRGRGQSNVIGAVMLIGIVLTSATLIAFAGASVMDQYRELAGQESTTNAIEEIDTELSSVASVGGLTRAEFSLGDARPSQYRIVRSGHINVTANRNASCRAHVPLSSLRYERGDGVTIGYEAGGVWRQQGGLVSQTVMHTPPDVTFENGTLSMTVINVSGEVDGAKNVVTENVSRSIQTNDELVNALFTGDCARPDNVTVSVTSDFYRAWGGYFRTSINATSYSTFDSNDTARVYFDQDVLPEETDDSRNNVVDLNDTAFNDVEVTNNSIKVNKSANNTYTAIVTPLSSGSTQVGEVRVVEDDTAYRPPMDVVFVVDESGSMSWDPDGDGDTKMEEARAAAKAFVGKMNSSYDRAGVVGFDYSGDIKLTPPPDREYVTTDFGTNGVNGSIDDFHANGGTDIGSGLHEGNVIFGVKSNSSRNKVIVLLSDGENDDPEDPTCDNDPGSDSDFDADELACMNQKAFDEADRADKDGVTIHAIGFGSADNATLKDVAETTGGSYRYVADADDLSSVFVDLFAEISESKQIMRDPVSMQLQAGGTTFYPQIDGNTTHVANGSSGALNLNDPTAPAGFSYSIDVSDGENVSMTALDYDCLTWERTGTIYENDTTGQEYAEVRCVEIDQSSRTEVSPSDTSVYVDGDDVSSLLDQPSDWWNDDLKNGTLAPYLGGPNNETLRLESNQAVVVFEFEDDDGATDRLIALYRIGQSKQQAVPKYVFNLEVRYLEIGDDA